MKNKKKYKRPEMTAKRINVSLFMGKHTALDQYMLIEQVYASSGTSSWADTSSDNCGTSGSCL